MVAIGGLLGGRGIETNGNHRHEAAPNDSMADSQATGRPPIQVARSRWPMKLFDGIQERFVRCDGCR